MNIIDSIMQEMDGRYDEDSVRAALASIEELPYGLIHILFQEIAGLEALAADSGTGENVGSRDYLNHPAVSRYEELHGPVKMILRD